MRLESRLYRTVQAERAVRGEHEQYGCPDAHENAHASDLHDMEPRFQRDQGQGFQSVQSFGAHLPLGLRLNHQHCHWYGKNG